MKKASLFLMCAIPLAVSGCYSTPEFKETIGKHQKYQETMGCDSSNAYQHAGYRKCVEETALIKEKNKKTVYFAEDVDGRSLVIPKAAGAEEMKDPTMVYPVVDIREKEVVVIQEGNSPSEEPAKVTEETVSETTTKTTETTVEVTKTTVEVTSPAPVEAVANEGDKAETPVEVETASEMPANETEQPSSFMDIQIEEEVIEPTLDGTQNITAEPVNTASDAGLQAVVTETSIVEAQIPTLSTTSTLNEKEVLPLEEK